MYIKFTNWNFYDWDLDEYLSEKEFVDKIKTDEKFTRTYGENLDLFMENNGEIGM